MKKWFWWAVGALASGFVFFKLMFYRGPVPVEITTGYAITFLAIMVAFGLIFCICLSKVIDGMTEKN